MKSTKKTKISTLSRQLQKTFIITATLAYLVQSVMIGQFFYTMLTGQFPDVSAYVLYPITTMVLPALSFLLVYLISGSRYTRLWRTCQAAIVGFLAVITEGFFSAVSIAIFSSQLGYGDAPAVDGAPLLQVLSPVVTLAVVAAAGGWLRRQKATPSGDASALFQKGFIVLLPLFSLGQMVVMYFGYTNSGALAQAMDTGMLMGILTSLVIPAIIWMILFLLTPREKTTLQRVFISLIFCVIGVLVFTVCISATYLVSLMGMIQQEGGLNTAMNTVSPVLALALFAGLVAWHKWGRLL